MNSKNRMIDWKGFYLSMAALVIPMSLQNVINVSVTAADVFMLGAVGEKVLSGSSLAGQVQFIMTLLLFGITSGTMILSSQYWGKKDTDTIEKILAVGLGMGVIVGITFTVVAQIFPTQIMGFYTSDSEVIEEGVKYLRIVSYAYTFMAVTQIYLFVMRSIQRVVVATVVYSISLCANVAINAILIFGLFGLPTLGIQGAAIGTLIARILELIMVIIYAKGFNNLVKVRLHYIFTFDKNILGDILKYTGPVVLHQVLWGVAFSMHSMVMGNMGSEAVAANAVIQMIRQYSMVVVYGVSNATAVVLGKAMGADKKDWVRSVAKRCVIISVALGCLSSVVILVAGQVIQSFLELSEQALEYMEIMLVVVAIYSLFNSYSCTNIVGIFRAGGDTRFSMIMDGCIMWLFCIPLACIGAFVFSWGVPLVYFILLSDETIKAPIVYNRFRSYKWLNNITRNS